MDLCSADITIYFSPPMNDVWVEGFLENPHVTGAKESTKFGGPRNLKRLQTVPNFKTIPSQKSKKLRNPMRTSNSNLWCSEPNFMLRPSMYFPSLHLSQGESKHQKTSGLRTYSILLNTPDPRLCYLSGDRVQKQFCVSRGRFRPILISQFLEFNSEHF